MAAQDHDEYVRMLKERMEKDAREVIDSLPYTRRTEFPDWMYARVPGDVLEPIGAMLRNMHFEWHEWLSAYFYEWQDTGIQPACAEPPCAPVIEEVWIYDRKRVRSKLRWTIYGWEVVRVASWALFPDEASALTSIIGDASTLTQRVLIHVITEEQIVADELARRARLGLSRSEGEA